jgi:hypothetical protein
MGFSPKNAIETMFLLVIIIICLSPALRFFTAPTYAQNMTNQALYLNTSMKSSIWNPLFNASLTSNNGFYANFFSFSGLAFVFSSIGAIMNIFLNVPSMLVYTISSSLVVMGLPTMITAMVIGMLLTFLLITVVVLGIITYMKASWLWTGV